MAIVVDTSVILAVVLNEPGKSALIRLTTGAELLAPVSLHWEIGNALSSLFKRRRITEAEGQQALDEYQKIPIRFLDVPLDEALHVAAQHRIYAYDAYFLVCAYNQPGKRFANTLYRSASRCTSSSYQPYRGDTMKSYTFSEARQQFASVLEQARLDGSVRIQRRDGQSFVLTPESPKVSPLDVPGITPKQPVTRKDILQSIQEGRRSYD